MANRKRKNNSLQNSIQNSKDRVPRTPLTPKEDPIIAIVQFVNCPN